METPILITERLVLRPIRIEDAPRIQQNFAHWDIVKYMAITIPWPYPADGAKDYLENVALKSMTAGESHHWAITEKSDLLSQHIGSITLYPNNPKESRGFWMAEAYQRRGYMNEAVIAVNDFAFDVLKMPELILNNAIENVGSRRIKETSGAELIETYQHECVIGKVTSERWRLTAEAWRKSRHKLAPQPETKAARKPVSTMMP